LNQEQLLQIEGFGELSATNLLAGINKSKSKPLPKLLTALGIKHLGPAASESLAKTFGSLDRIMEATEEELSNIDGVGGVIAQSIANWFKQKPNKAIIEKLRKGGVEFGNVVTSDLPQRLPATFHKTWLAKRLWLQEAWRGLRAKKQKQQLKIAVESLRVR